MTKIHLQLVSLLHDQVKVYTTTSISATSNSKISITRITSKSQINQDKPVYLNSDKSQLRRSSRLSK